MRVKDFEKALKDVEKFLNRPQLKNHIISIMNTSFGIVVWYEAANTLKIMLKKP